MKCNSFTACSGSSRRRDYYDRGYDRGYDDRDYYSRSYRWGNVCNIRLLFKLCFLIYISTSI